MSKKKIKKVATETKLFSASDAKKSSIRRAIKNRDQAVNDILEKIKSFSNNGESVITLPMVSLAVSKRLIELGFDLIHDKIYCDKSIVIKW